MSGDYYGYDGPCPPWNDAIVHRYIFTLYALDVDRVPLEGKFTGQQVRDMTRRHTLAEAKITGTYTLNPSVAGKARAG
jgi:Raf kinase inhibitor-like YbhB/YbcL family protein